MSARPLFPIVGRKPMSAFTASERKVAEAMLDAREITLKRLGGEDRLERVDASTKAPNVQRFLHSARLRVKRGLGKVSYLRRYLRRGAR